MDKTVVLVLFALTVLGLIAWAASQNSATTFDFTIIAYLFIALMG